MRPRLTIEAGIRPLFTNPYKEVSCGSVRNHDAFVKSTHDLGVCGYSAVSIPIPTSMQCDFPFQPSSTLSNPMSQSPTVTSLSVLYLSS